MTAPVDTPTADRVVQALRDARLRCQSPVHALNQAGVLMTDHLAQNIRADVLENTAELIRHTRIKNLYAAGLIPKDPTPAVMVKVIADLVADLALKARKGEYR